MEMIIKHIDEHRKQKKPNFLIQSPLEPHIIKKKKKSASERV